MAENSSSSSSSLETEVRAARVSAHRVAHTIRVLHVIDLCRRQFLGTNIHTLCAVLLQGCADKCALLDCSLALKANETDAVAEPFLVHLIRLILLYQPTRAQGNDIPPEFAASWAVFSSGLSALLPQLMRSVDSITVRRVFEVVASSDRVLVPWAEQFCARLMVREFDRDAIDSAGRTPIMLAAESGNGSAVLMLHLMGAEINVQRLSDGAGVLHALAERGAYDALLDLFSRAPPELDLFLVDHAGHTAADLAAIRHAQQQQPAAGQAYWKSAQILALQTDMFRKTAAPLIRRMLSEHMLPDLASIVVGYIDGSGLAHPTAAASAAPAESTENDEE